MSVWRGWRHLVRYPVDAKKCHRRITSEKDVPALSKSTRIYEKRIGVRKSARPFRGWRKFNGDVVWKDKR